MVLSGQGLDPSAGKSNATSSADASSLATGQTHVSTTTCAQPEPISSESTLSAAGSLARTSAARESALALLALARDCGVSSLASSELFAQRGSSLRTLPAEQPAGSTPWCATWQSSAMRRYRSRCRQAMSARLTGELACSSLRATLTAKGNLLAPSMQKWAGHRALLPTLCARDHKGPGPSHTKGGTDLPTSLGLRGRSLSPTWCEWFMGFPVGWTEPPPESAPSVTRSSLNAPRSSGISSASSLGSEPDPGARARSQVGDVGLDVGPG